MAQTGWIYIVRMRNGGRLKVGYSTNPKARIRALQTANPDKLEIVAILPGDLRDEARLHELLKRKGKHMGGEWFVDDPETRAILAPFIGASRFPAIPPEIVVEDVLKVVGDLSKEALRWWKVLSKKR